jgi:hypothetical protein
MSNKLGWDSARQEKEYDSAVSFLDTMHAWAYYKACHPLTPFIPAEFPTQDPFAITPAPSHTALQQQDKAAADNGPLSKDF